MINALETGLDQRRRAAKERQAVAVNQPPRKLKRKAGRPAKKSPLLEAIDGRGFNRSVQNAPGSIRMATGSTAKFNVGSEPTDLGTASGLFPSQQRRMRSDASRKAAAQQRVAENVEKQARSPKVKEFRKEVFGDELHSPEAFTGGILRDKDGQIVRDDDEKIKIVDDLTQAREKMTPLQRELNDQYQSRLSDRKTQAKQRRQEVLADQHKAAVARANNPLNSPLMQAALAGSVRRDPVAAAGLMFGQQQGQADNLLRMLGLANNRARAVGELRLGDERLALERDLGQGRLDLGRQEVQAERRADRREAQQAEQRLQLDRDRLEAERRLREAEQEVQRLRAESGVELDRAEAELARYQGSPLSELMGIGGQVLPDFLQYKPDEAQRIMSPLLQLLDKRLAD
jgi:hypothetical protein